MPKRVLHNLLLFMAIAIMVATLLQPDDATAQERKKIIFDTDIASDIDDAFAHALVQVSDEFEVLGITMAYGPTDRRARVSCRMLWECGQEDIPVAVGRPLNAEGDARPQLIWGDGFEALRPVDEPAADFIIRMLRRYPGEITIISVGPVTNLGDVIRKDPEAWGMVKEVYSMFGSFYMGYDESSRPDAEWNVRADVESSKLLVESGAPITYAGLDVTTMVKFEEDRRLQLALRRSPLTDALTGLYTLWSGNDYTRDPTLFDCVAVMMAMEERFVSTRAAYVTVDDEGYTHLVEGREPNCRIGVRIQTRQFLDWLTLRLLQQNLMRGG